MHWENLFDAVKDILPSADIFIYRDDSEIKGFIGITGNRYIAGLEGAVRFYEKNNFVISESKMNPDFKHEEYHMGWDAER